MAINRRSLICSALILLPTRSFSAIDDFWSRDRCLELQRLDTKEKIFSKYYVNGEYLQDEYKKICWLLRDAKDQNQVCKIDYDLINLVYAQQEYFRIKGNTNPLITVTSGYRTPRRNVTIEGAARNSMHIYGQAIDITINNVSLQEITEVAAHLKVGGIGMYSNFIHIDTGKVRFWSK